MVCGGIGTFVVEPLEGIDPSDPIFAAMARCTAAHTFGLEATLVRPVSLSGAESQSTQTPDGYGPPAVPVRVHRLVLTRDSYSELHHDTLPDALSPAASDHDSSASAHPSPHGLKVAGTLGSAALDAQMIEYARATPDGANVIKLETLHEESDAAGPSVPLPTPIDECCEGVRLPQATTPAVPSPCSTQTTSDRPTDTLMAQMPRALRAPPGHIVVHINSLNPPPRVFIFGAGHCGLARL